MKVHEIVRNGKPTASEVTTEGGIEMRLLLYYYYYYLDKDKLIRFLD